MPLFKGGRRLLTKVEIMLMNNYAFSNAVVKMCEIFTYLTNKWHEINGKYYFLTNIHIILQFFLHCSEETLTYS
jgi:hypothetical protein